MTAATAPLHPHWSALSAAERARRAHLAATTLDPAGLSALLSTYLNARGTAARSHASYRARLPAVLLFLKREGQELLRPQPELAERFLRFMVEWGTEPAVLLRAARTLRALYAALTWVGLLAFDPFEGLDMQATVARLYQERRPLPQT